MHPLIASALNSGPAVDLYAALIAAPPMSQRWLEEIRTRWGQPDHPSLALFPSVQEQTIQLPSRDTNVADLWRARSSAGTASLHARAGCWPSLQRA